MTKEDADTLKKNISDLSTEELGLLWRWINSEYFKRLSDDAERDVMYKKFHPKEPKTYA